MKALISLAAIFTAAPALAHPGHLVGAAGHDHWVAGIALGAALGVTLWAGLKGRRKDAAKDEGEKADPEAKEQEA